jgi:hypothetical protein
VGADVNCANHPEIPGVGVCVSCRQVVCASCTTRLQGRNFCVDCLQARARDAQAQRDEGSTGLNLLWIALALASAIGLTASLTGLGFTLYVVG